MGYFLFIIFGYLSGSILFARLIPKFFCHIDVCEISEDHNPGTFNVFRHVGVGLGILVILLELAKGFVPVFLAGRCLDMERAVFGLVLAAPVLGHGWPLWDLKGGGKSIAVSFGVLLGLFPQCGPVIMLAVFYLLFSLVIVIGPHFFRLYITVKMYPCSGGTDTVSPGLRYCESGTGTVSYTHLDVYKRQPQGRTGIN